MPADYTRPALQRFSGATFQFKIEAELAARINQLSLETGSTLFMVLLATFNILLAKYANQEDVVIGSPNAGRLHTDLKNIVGIFVNTLAMRNYPEKNKSFRNFLSEVRENALKAFENQDYQFEELVDKLNLRRDLSRNPLFDIMLVLQNIDDGNVAIAGLKITPYRYESDIAKFDLCLTAIEDKSEIQLFLEYCTKLFKPETVQRMAGHFIRIITEISQNPELKLSAIEMITAAEKTADPRSIQPYRNQLSEGENNS